MMTSPHNHVYSLPDAYWTTAGTLPMTRVPSSPFAIGMYSSGQHSYAVPSPKLLNEYYINNKILDSKQYKLLKYFTCTIIMIIQV